MVDRLLHSDNAVPLALLAPINDSALMLQLEGPLAGWPSSPSTASIVVTIGRGTTTEERVLCEPPSTGGATVLNVRMRGAGGTAALDHSAGESVEHTLAAFELEQSNVHILATTGVHGVTGAIAGTTSTQTLTNKTISGTSNTLINVPQASTVGLTADLANRYTKTETNNAFYTKTQSDSRYIVPSTVNFHIDRAVPIGTVMMWALKTTPPGWVSCQGQAVTSALPDLRAALIAAGSPYGTSGADPLVPNLVARVPMGVAAAGVGGRGGASTVSTALTVANIPVHSHPITVASNGAHTHEIIGPGGSGSNIATITAQTASGTSTNDRFIHSGGAHSHTATAGNTGSGSAFTTSTLQPYLELMFIIRASGANAT